LVVATRGLNGSKIVGKKQKGKSVKRNFAAIAKRTQVRGREPVCLKCWGMVKERLALRRAFA